MKSFNEVEWIIGFVEAPGDLTVDGIDRIKNFVFMWNLYETFACETHADLGKISVAVEKLMSQPKPLDINEVRGVLEYFKSRYTRNGVLLPRFDALKFPNGDYKDLVVVVLTNVNVEPNDQLKALLYIVYRFRNNLFHGNKKVAELNGQVDNFIAANYVLKVVLEAMSNNYMIY